ncbi:MAG TPA: tRNA preQ1(34) S-adenosylmethionine ribosyltransferase-isomerase QueA [Candidatus Eisenbacteria bacterium]|nr:tRNA preQ1(34) S-adenosylmethionine ribosyltransferase-isomerase QueA [Candidatus Eisenbacteria bacterium]
MRLGDLDYELPPELIAQEPAAERSAARLLVLDRATGAIRHDRIAGLPAMLRRGDLLVLNDTRVIPARVRGRRPTGGRVEVLVCEPVDVSRGIWTVLAKGAARVGERVHFADGGGEWIRDLGEGRWHLRLDVGRPVLAWLETAGEVPLPPYIRRPEGPSAADLDRYQTLFARVPGAVAAPTAGLHFTPALLGALEEAGVAYVFVTLHVGPGTFLPIRTDDLADYRMAPERYAISASAASAIGRALREQRRVVAVGTTTVRALESAAVRGDALAGAGEAGLFIQPGHEFRVVGAMLTNFHLPRTPLLAMVAALAGWERVRAAYEEAVRARYRFYSYGDAMLIV